MSTFQLQAHLDRNDRATQRQFALTARTADELANWQQSFRAALASVLGIAGRSVPVINEVKRLSSIDKGSYTEEMFSLALEDVMVPFYLLTPNTSPPHKLIMAFHGHGPGVHMILGNYPDEATRQTHIANDENFAQRLAEAGYMVCAIEQRGLGERVTSQVDPQQFNRACRHLAFDYLLHGKTLLGERVREAAALLNYMYTREDVRLDNIGCTGHSGGATTALFFAALEPRISSIVLSGYFCTYIQSILGMSHCECNYVPNLLTLGDVGEIAALLAARPLHIIQGEHDPIFPLAGVTEPWSVLQHAYALAGAPDACALTVHPGGHTYDCASSLAHFQRTLGAAG